MKKYLVVLAAAVFALASCGGGGSKYTSLKFKESKIQLAQGQTKKLQVLYEPTTLDAPVCVWASSNPDIVKVDQNGNIEAWAIGSANITATTGEGESQLQAVCQVEVKSVYDMLVWSQFGCFDVDTDSPIGEPYEVETRSGVKYTAHLFPGVWYLWDDNIQFVDGEGFSGAGFFSEIETPIELVEYNGGYALWTNEIVFKDLAADSAGVCPAGALTNAEEWYAYITDSTYKGDGSFKGAPVHYVDFDNDDYYYFQGFIKNGWIGDYYDGEVDYYYYQMNITWMDGVYGLEINEAGDDFAQPATFANREDKYYENMPSEVAAPVAMPRSIKHSNNKPLHRPVANKTAMKVFSLK